MSPASVEPLPDLLSPEHLADPYPGYARLRRDHPVQEIAPGGIFAVSSFDDVAFVLKHPEIFSSAGFAQSLNPSWLSYPCPLGISLITKDGDDHTRLRRLVSRAFLPRRLGELEPRIRVIASELADHMLEARDVDFVAALASRMPARVIAEVVGFDPSKEEDIQRWMPLFDAVSVVRPSDEVVDAVNSMLEEVDTDFRALIAERRVTPRDDMISELVSAEVDGSPLSDDEAVSFLCTLMVGGIDTTKCLLGNLMVRLTSDPDRWAHLRSAPEDVPLLVDEVLRADAPVSGTFRIVATDVELGGQSLPAGSLVLALLSSATTDTVRSFRRIDDPQCQRPDLRAWHPLLHRRGAGEARGAGGAGGAAGSVRRGRTILRRGPCLDAPADHSGREVAAGVLDPCLSLSFRQSLSRVQE